MTRKGDKDKKEKEETKKVEKILRGERKDLDKIRNKIRRKRREGK